MKKFRFLVLPVIQPCFLALHKSVWLIPADTQVYLLDFWLLVLYLLISSLFIVWNHLVVRRCMPASSSSIHVCFPIPYLSLICQRVSQNLLTDFLIALLLIHTKTSSRNRFILHIINCALAINSEVEITLFS